MSKNIMSHKESIDTQASSPYMSKKNSLTREPPKMTLSKHFSNSKF